MLECAYRCEDVEHVIVFGERLRANGLWERKVFELELSYREEYNDWKGCKQILQGFIESPLDETYLPYARAHLSHVAGALGEIDSQTIRPL